MDSLISDAKIAQFCDAVRAKNQWVFKVAQLGEKWATEAGLIQPRRNVDKRVTDALWELNAEAERIRIIDYRVNYTPRSLPERDIDFKTIEEDVRAAVKLARTSTHTLRSHEPRDKAGIFVSDGLVPSSLHQELVRELDSLAALEPKDFHPGTVGKVQDLIHPSLYPYIAGVSPVSPGVELPRFENGKFETSVHFHQDSLEHTSQYAWIPSFFTLSEERNDVTIDSYINGLGPRDRYPTLYRLIEQLFLVALPHFEKTILADFEIGQTSSGQSTTSYYSDMRPDSSISVKRWLARLAKRGPDGQATREEWAQTLAQSAKEKEEDMLAKKKEESAVFEQQNNDFINRQKSVAADDPDIVTALEGNDFKVIVKAATYILKPGQFYEGTWHLEGMPHEKIVASFIYYYDTNEFVRDDGLSFRRVRIVEADFPIQTNYMHYNFEIMFVAPEPNEGEEEEEEEGMDRDYPSDWDDDHQYVPLGTVPTTFAGGSAPAPGHGTGRIISFPNWVQHKVQGLRHSSSSSDATMPPAIRKILCFFLVDDYPTETLEYPAMTYAGLEDVHVLTTVDVPLQDRESILPTLRDLLPRICEARTGKQLPTELVEMIISHGIGLTREMAEHHRRAFMEDRKIKSSKESGVLEFEFSLCEH
ncbi:hypothetical protein ONZ45_g11152 [Pleurotus djamor]|nr:hypothetical protein ONZ45_g11152 [Pleurotus djamor]